MDEPDILKEKDHQMESEETEQPSGEGGEKMKINEKQETSKFDLNQTIDGVLIRKFYEKNEEVIDEELIHEDLNALKKNRILTLKSWSKLPVEDREKIVTNQVPFPIPIPIANYLDEISGIKVNYF